MNPVLGMARTDYAKGRGELEVMRVDATTRMMKMTMIIKVNLKMRMTVTMTTLMMMRMKMKTTMGMETMMVTELQNLGLALVVRMRQLTTMAAISTQRQEDLLG
jgi:hypothetical protein